jgi:hypothetical protein
LSPEVVAIISHISQDASGDVGVREHDKPRRLL